MSDAGSSAKYSIPIPAELDAQVRDDMVAEGYGSLTEYVRAALREKVRRAARRRLEEQLLVAVERGDYGRPGPELWARLERLAKGEEG